MRGLDEIIDLNAAPEVQPEQRHKRVLDAVVDLGRQAATWFDNALWAARWSDRASERERINAPWGAKP